MILTTSTLTSGLTVAATFSKTPLFTSPLTYKTFAMAHTAAKRITGASVVNVNGTFYVKLPVPVTRMF